MADIALKTQERDSVVAAIERSLRESYPQMTQRPPWFYVQIHEKSPWAIFAAHMVKDGEPHKVLEIKEYIYLQDLQKAGAKFDEARYAELLETIRDQYLIDSDFSEFAQDDPEFSQYLMDVIDYLEPITANDSYRDHDAPEDRAKGPENQAARNGLLRAKTVNDFRSRYIEDLIMQINSDKEFWLTEEQRENTQDFPEDERADFRTETKAKLHKAMQRMDAAVRKIDSILDGSNPKLYQQIVEGRKRSLDRVVNPHERFEPRFIDAVHNITPHRNATQFRDSTSSYYVGLHGLMSALNLHMPDYELYLEDMDTMRYIEDPVFQFASSAAKISYVARKHDLGFSEQDVDFAAMCCAMVEHVTRGYENEEIHDTFKKDFHNTGNHQISMMVTAAAMRDSSLARMNSDLQAGLITEEEAKAASEIIQDFAGHTAKWSAMHDVSEVLTEVVGARLSELTEFEQRRIRKCKHAYEAFVMSDYVRGEFMLRARMIRDQGIFSYTDDQLHGMVDEILYLDGIITNPDHPEEKFNTSIYQKMKKCYDRISSQQDLNGMRAPGQVNEKGALQFAENVSPEGVAFTAKYLLSRITGYELESNDVEDRAEHGRERREQQHANSLHDINSAQADAVGAPRKHNRAATHETGVKRTDRGIDDFLSETNVNYEKSVFKDFADLVIANQERVRNGDMTQEEANAQQIANEHMLYSVCYETTHHSKKHARQSGLDERKVEAAVRKNIAQGIALAKQHLNAFDLDMRCASPAEWILEGKRYKPFSISRDKWKMLQNKRAPHQRTNLQQPFHKVATATEDVLGGTAQWADKATNTLANQMATFLLNKRFTEKEHENVISVIKGQESLADIALSLTGTLNGTELDEKSASILSPILTDAIDMPMQHLDAIRKSYPYILNQYGDQIASQYGVEMRDFGLLRTTTNLRKGEFQRNPTDLMHSGHVAQQMYHYFKEKYDPSYEAPDPYPNKISVGTEDSKLAKKFDDIERVMLCELMNTEIVKHKNNALAGFSTAQKRADLDRAGRIREMQKHLERSAPSGRFLYWWKKLRSVYGMDMRMTFVGGLGVLFAYSSVGLQFSDLGQAANFITTQMAGVSLPSLGLDAGVLGTSLAAATGATLLSSLSRKFNRYSNALGIPRFIRSLPYAERTATGWSIVSQNKRSPEHYEKEGRKAIRRSMKNGVLDRRALVQNISLISPISQEQDSLLVSLRDSVIATGTSLFRCVAGLNKPQNNHGMSAVPGSDFVSSSWRRQNTVTIADSVGVWIDSVPKMISSLASGDIGSAALSGGQTAAQYIAMQNFVMVSVLQIYKQVCEEILQKGGNPTMEAAKAETLKRLQDHSWDEAYCLIENVSEWVDEHDSAKTIKDRSFRAASSPIALATQAAFAVDSRGGATRERAQFLRPQQTANESQPPQPA